MRAVVTGGAGFLGSHLGDRLLAEGWRVVAVDNFLTGSVDNIEHLRAEPNFEFLEQDVSNGLEVGGRVDFVFHFASPASPDDFSRLPFEVMKVNSIGTEHALELALRHGAKFMFASTSEVYGDPQISPQPETYWGNVNPNGPRSVYDESKRYGEALTMAYHRYRNLDTRLVRFFNTYGPRMRLDDGRVVPNLVGQALRGEPLTVYGDGKQTRSFGYYEDIVDGVWRLANSDVHTPVNIGTDEERTILEFAEAVLQATGSSSPIVHKEALVDDPKQRRADNRKAAELLGWRPTTPLAEGLKKTIPYFQEKIGKAPAGAGA